MEIQWYKHTPVTWNNKAKTGKKHVMSENIKDKTLNSTYSLGLQSKIEIQWYACIPKVLLYYQVETCLLHNDSKIMQEIF